MGVQGCGRKSGNRGESRKERERVEEEDGGGVGVENDEIRVEWRRNARMYSWG